MKICAVNSRTIILANIGVFFASTFVNWLKADIPYWPLILHDAGFIWAEIPSIIQYKSTLLGFLETGVSILLFLLFYSFGKKYKLTRKTVAFLLALLSASVLLGFLFGYGIKQIEMFKYSIFAVSTLYLLPSELSSKIVWCMLGVISGNYTKKVDKNA